MLAATGAAINRIYYPPFLSPFALLIHAVKHRETGKRGVDPTNALTALYEFRLGVLGRCPTLVGWKGATVDAQERYTAEEADFFRLTGEIIREWIELELFLSRWLIYLLAVDEFRARIVWDSFTSFRARLALVRKLIRNFADESIWDDAERILSKVEKIAEKRNMLAHKFGHLGERVGNLVFVEDAYDREGEANFIAVKSINRANLRSWLSDINTARNEAATFKQERLATAIYRESLFHRRKINEPPVEEG
ncbi:hypothetical protein GCM10009095_25360 [Sphingomonas molluscorum]|nr:hypothetical protein GCM10017606_00530 [Microbacterium terregens]